MSAPQPHDRRDSFRPLPRPAWMKILNDIGSGLDSAGIVPLTPDSLIGRVTATTGLSDFGDPDWLEPFTILARAIDDEAGLHLAGRLVTRAELLIHLEARLRVTDCYRNSPQIEAEVIDRPVFITGYGRSGTTILFEVLSQDPQFRTARKWESLFPVPPPEAASYRTDPRIARTEALNRLIEEITPEFAGLHKIGGELPVESLELEYASFASEIYPLVVQVPSYAAWLRVHGLLGAFQWQKRLLKLLQSRNRAAHWLMKSPSHLVHLEDYLGVFPGMRVIFAHRDPLASADSVISFMGTLFWQRTDDIWKDGAIDVEVMAMADRRAAAWDPVIAMIQDGRLPAGNHASFHYARFISDPMGAIQSVYDQLGMQLTTQAAGCMRAYLAARTKGRHGVHHYEQAPSTTVQEERPLYARYQSFFGVADEIQ